MNETIVDAGEGGQVEMFDPEELQLDSSPNPMVQIYGPAQGNKRCRGCSHLQRRQIKAHIVYCCSKRGPEYGHRSHWTACQRYEEARHEKTPAKENL